MADAAIQVSVASQQRIRNFGASFLFLLIFFLIYRFAPHSAALLDFSDAATGLAGCDVLAGGFIGYGLLLLAFYLTEKAPHESKSIAALRAIRALVLAPLSVYREGLPYRDRLGLLTLLLKGFFAPLMVLSLFQYTSTMAANGVYLFDHASEIGAAFLQLFNSHGFWFLFQVIVFFDVFFFTVGYLVEHPRLNNEIRSVDPTWLGWAVALACYPPFNGIVVQVLGWGGTEFPQFADPFTHITVNSVLLVMMAIYTWASVALNLKASNLTHRGIISHGPYRYVRHPAYICKNAAWWLGTIPALAAAWNVSAWDAMMIAGSACAWSAIYVLRALTEEDHLRKVDGEYDAYCRQVRYRFIPGIY